MDMGLGRSSRLLLWKVHPRFSGSHGREEILPDHSSGVAPDTHEWTPTWFFFVHMYVCMLMLCMTCVCVSMWRPDISLSVLLLRHLFFETGSLAGLGLSN